MKLCAPPTEMSLPSLAAPSLIRSSSVTRPSPMSLPALSTAPAVSSTCQAGPNMPLRNVRSVFSTATTVCSGARIGFTASSAGLRKSWKKLPISSFTLLKPITGGAPNVAGWAGSMGALVKLKLPARSALSVGNAPLPRSDLRCRPRFAEPVNVALAVPSIEKAPCSALPLSVALNRRLDRLASAVKVGAVTSSVTDSAGFDGSATAKAPLVFTVASKLTE